MRAILLILVTSVVLTYILTNPSYDVLISDVRYLEKDKFTEDEFNIGIKGDKIEYIGKGRTSAKLVINGKGLFLAPGLLDTNSCGWVSEKSSKIKIFDGFTSYLNAHGDPIGHIQSRYKTPTYINSATTIGVYSYVERFKENTFNLGKALSEAIAEGAYGISISPEYWEREMPPSLITEICTYFKAQNIPISFHLRHSSLEKELTGLQEAIDCASYDVPIHLLHLHSTGATYQPKVANEMILSARAAGRDIVFDFYPYTFWGSQAGKARFENGWLEKYNVSVSQIFVPGRGTGISIDEFNRIRLEEPGLLLMVDSIPRTTLDYFALRTDAFLGTDSIVTDHPRGAGSFTKFYEDFVRTKRITMGEALYRFSTLAMKKFSQYIPGLESRGMISEGWYADLVLWDIETILSNATQDGPRKESTGVVAAIVNGVPVVMNRRLTLPKRLPGKFFEGGKIKIETDLPGT